MAQNVQEVLHGYVEAYSRLYNRTPNDLRALDNEWVIVNGARMRASELEYLTRQLQIEYDQVTSQRRSIVKRLINWFKA